MNAIGQEKDSSALYSTGRDDKRAPRRGKKTSRRRPDPDGSETLDCLIGVMARLWQQFHDIGVKKHANVVRGLQRGAVSDAETNTGAYLEDFRSQPARIEWKCRQSAPTRLPLP